MMRNILTVILAITLSACDPEIKGNALYLGDSLMASAVGDIAQQNTARGNSVLTMFEVMGGESIEHSPYLAARLENIQMRIALDMVFISLGTNVYDLALNGSEDIARILNSISPQTKIYWVLPHSNVRASRDIDEYDSVLSSLNSASTSGNWPNLTLLSFDEYAESNGVNLVDSWIGPDGVHLSPEGETAWTEMLYSHQED